MPTRMHAAPPRGRGRRKDRRRLGSSSAPAGVERSPVARSRGVARKSGPALAASLLLLVGGLAAAAGGDAGAVLDVRSSVEKWIAAQHLIDEERQAWRQEKEVLASRIDLLGSEIAAVEARLAEARERAAEARARDQGLEAERARLVETAAVLAGSVGDLEAEVRLVARRVPEAFQERIAPLLQRIPEGAAQISVAERFQNVLGILNELQRINGEITVATEIRPLASGELVQVTTVYFGLGQAYYRSAGGETGVGRPGPEGWVWEADGRASREIAEMLDIVESKGSPKFVNLPVEVR